MVQFLWIKSIHTYCPHLCVPKGWGRDLHNSYRLRYWIFQLFCFLPWEKQYLLRVRCFNTAPTSRRLLQVYRESSAFPFTTWCELSYTLPEDIQDIQDIQMLSCGKQPQAPTDKEGTRDWRQPEMQHLGLGSFSTGRWFQTINAAYDAAHLALSPMRGWKGMKQATGFDEIIPLKHYQTNQAGSEQNQRSTIGYTEQNSEQKSKCMAYLIRRKQFLLADSNNEEVSTINRLWW